MAYNAATDFIDWMVSTVSEISFAQRRIKKSAPIVSMTATKKFVFKSGVVAPDQEFDALDGLGQKLISEKVSQVELSIEPSLYFSRHLSPSKLPRSRALALATLDLNENFPFLRNNCYLFVHNQVDGARYVVLRHTIVDPIVSLMGRNNITISALHIHTGVKTCVLPSAAGILEANHHRGTVTKFARTAILAVSFVCLVWTVTHAYTRNASAISELNDRIQARQHVVSAIIKRNKTRDDLTKLQQQARSAKLGTQPVHAVLDNLTAFLPDTAWLTDVSFANSEITITGYSAAAADLIPILEASGSFRDVKFTSQVTRVPGQNGERFSIRMITNARH